MATLRRAQRQVALAKGDCCLCEEKGVRCIQLRASGANPWCALCADCAGRFAMASDANFRQELEMFAASQRGSG